MSEMDYVEPSSDSFWEIGQYKRTVKRCEDGYKLCNDMVQMISERADLEKQYSKSLKAWSKKWNDYLLKGSEYGSMKNTWMSSLNEADRLAEIHLNVHNVLNDELNKEIKEWQKQNYPKSIVNQLKTAKEYEEEFKKAQKPWSKKYALVEKTKKDYHSACKSFQTAKVQCANSQNDPAISAEQKKKFEDKVEKHKKECEINKSKYKQALEDLNQYNSHYIEDMNNVYKKCDSFEKDRLEFFIQKFLKLHGHLNITEKNIDDIYSDFMRTIKQTNPDKDLIGWSKEFGSGMAMNWPVFEEYSEELKTIAKGNKAKASKDINVDNNGVTMTSIKHKTDDLNDDNRSYLSSANDLSRNTYKPGSTTGTSVKTNNNNGTGRESNPFGDDEDDDDHTNEINIKNSSQQNTSPRPTNSSSNDTTNNDDSDDDRPNTYLNVRVKALYDYTSAEDDELSFKAGEEFIKLAPEDERGWCLGKIGEKIGLYPATYATNA
jgi:protein kinase C and casein kinase substrate in neurons protein